jgi:DNA-binding transcriptional LysR family regulator
MLEKLEALRALQSTGTMGRAAVVLRVTQSAVSKRIAALQDEVGKTLIEQHGRHVRLTSAAERLLLDATPLLEKLREVVQAQTDSQTEVLRIAATDSLLASWLPATLRSAIDRCPGMQLELHAHRGPMLLERVRSGDYALGVCPATTTEGELLVRVLGREPMVIVPARLERLRPTGVIPVWAIEQRSLTWEAIATQVGRLRNGPGFALEIKGRLESFTALVQVARAGFAHALVPIGVAKDLGVPVDRLLLVPELYRPIAVVGRRSTFTRPTVRKLLAALRVVWPQL